ncbi:hypothetical protein V5N11_032237 [Cardamine amara subsp. amara]|uniref:RING-type domain-containing protein n=1 Tax=Cardamine amara subsp. amara TaxID=228776 RepID=A0ABD1A0P1_CARAN
MPLNSLSPTLSKRFLSYKKREKLNKRDKTKQRIFNQYICYRFPDYSAIRREVVGEVRENPEDFLGKRDDFLLLPASLLPTKLAFHFLRKIENCFESLNSIFPGENLWLSGFFVDTMIQMDGGDRLRVTLLDRMSTVENGRSSVTLEDVLMAETSSFQPPILTPPSPARNHSNSSSLLDVMRTERRRDKTAWKSLRDKLRLKRTTTGWISSNLIPSLDNPILTPDNNSNHINRLGFLLSNSETNQTSNDVSDEGRLRLGTVLAEERALSMEVQPPRMSLMELLEDNDGQMYDFSEREEAEEGEERGFCGGGGGETTVTVAAELGCCVCMVRSKGAAFIPCGHTFCRLCSRELWVQRGNCPLCNTSILQVLDIF